MLLFRDSFLKNFIALTCLMAWGTAYHHDVWLGLLNIDHHHSQVHDHVSGGHHHNHDHTPNPDSDEDDSLPVNESIPLPDTHTSAIALNSVKVLSTDQDLKFSGDTTIPFVSVTIKKLIRAGSENPPPPHGRDPVPTCRDILAFIVQANAPPFVS